MTKAILYLVLSLIALPATSAAQSGRASSSAGPGLSEGELKGKGLFLQSCSVCHLPPPEFKPKMRPNSGPMLVGLFANAKPDKEKMVREIILKGTQKMPGFQYSFTSQEMDDLIAFLKTLKDPDAYLNGL